jgi:phospholipid/cholesterol/gamma-HCH transport system permease protein
VITSKRWIPGGPSVDSALVRLPGYQGLKTVSEVCSLALATIRTLLTGTAWRTEFIAETAKAIRLSLVPLALTTVLLAIGGVTIYFGSVLKVIGTLDRMGLALQAALMREWSMWLTGMVIAGVVGSAITADLGARKIRGELDAMEVLAMDPVRELAVPRILACAFVTPLLGVFVVPVAHLATALATSSYHAGSVTTAGYAENALSSVWMADWINAIVKLFLAGVLVGIVSCQKGLAASGGSEGVGRAVNQCVLITFLGVFALDILCNLIFLSVAPDVSTLRA